MAGVGRWALGRGALKRGEEAEDPAADVPPAAERAGTLVLGLRQHPFCRADEGVGGSAPSRRWREQGRLPPDVEVLDGGTSGMDLLDQIAGRAQSHRRRRGPHRPAAGCGRAPCRRRGAGVLLGQAVAPRQLGLSDVLAVLRLMDAAPARITVIGVEPVCLDLDLEPLARRRRPPAGGRGPDPGGVGERLNQAATRGWGQSVLHVSAVEGEPLQFKGQAAGEEDAPGLLAPADEPAPGKAEVTKNQRHASDGGTGQQRQHAGGGHQQPEVDTNVGVAAEQRRHFFPDRLVAFVIDHLLR